MHNQPTHQEDAEQSQETVYVKPSEHEGKFGIGDKMTFYVDGKPIEAEVVQGEDADGVVVQTSERVNGHLINQYTREELDALTAPPQQANDNADVVSPKTPEAGTEVQNETGEEEKSPDELPAFDGDKFNETHPVDEIRQPQEEQNPNEENNAVDEASAISKIPQDEGGEYDYMQAEPSKAWAALLEQTEGDADMAREVAQSMLEDKVAELEEAQKQQPKEGKSVAEKIAARKEHKANIERIEKEIEQWQQIIQSGEEREAEEKSRSEEADETPAVDTKPESGVDGEEKSEDTLQPIGKGVFGNIYDQFKGKVKEAFDFLMKHKSGDLLGVFHRDGFGDIDLVWGDNGGGLAHIVQRHVEEQNDFNSVEEVRDVIDDVIKNGSINEKKSKWDKVVFEKDGYSVVVSRNLRDKDGNIIEQNKDWVVTAFDNSRGRNSKKRESSSDVTQVTPNTNKEGRAVAPNDNSPESEDTKSKAADKEKLDKLGKMGKAVDMNELPKDMAYRETDVNELEDILESGRLRDIPEDKPIEGISDEGVKTRRGRTFDLGRPYGRSHDGKGFAKGRIWTDGGGTLAGGTATKVIIGFPGNVTQWREGFHGSYSDAKNFDDIEHGRGLWLPFDENGAVSSLPVKDMKVWVEGEDGKFHEFTPKKPLSEQISTASAEVDTNPTEAQKEAGNYKKGHVQVGTFDITIEQPQGSIRRGTDANGKHWESKMHNTYGYFRGTEGVDGDHIDVFLSNDIDGWNGRKVFVVDQYNPDGTFDEHKVMLGFNDVDEAKSDYLANYENGWENGRRIDVTPVNLEDFEKWIVSSHRKTKAFAEYAGVKKEDSGASEKEGQGKEDVKPKKPTNEKGEESKADGEKGKGEKIEDVGEKIEGARKDALKKLAESMEQATEEALVAMPFSKAFKRPNLKKAVEDGVLREEDALFAQAVMSAYLSRKKPLMSKSRSNYERERSEKAIKIWAHHAYNGVEKLKKLFSLSPSERDTFMREEMNRPAYDPKDVEKRKQDLMEWNPGKVFNGTCYPINAIRLWNDVYTQLGYEVGTDVPQLFSEVLPTTGYDSYVLVAANGTKFYPARSLNSYNAVVDEIVYQTKVANADADTDHPKETFKVIGSGEMKTKSSGKWYVVTQASLSAKPHKDIFSSKEEAEKFAEAYMKNDGKKVDKYRYASEPKEVKEFDGYSEYAVVLRRRNIGKDTTTDFELKHYNTADEARAAIDAEHDELNELANKELAKDKGSKSASTKKPICSIEVYTEDGKSWKYGIVLSDKYAPKKSALNTMPYYLAKDFNTRKEAQAYLDAHKEEIEAKAAKVDEARRNFKYFTANGERVGTDYRHGEDVSADQFREQFGFRGVQFGNWTNQRDRQEAINQAFDAFMDLSRLLGVSPRALALNGELGVAFGARGSGKALAHYEPKEVVINLTKTSGAGSLAHEWWHALDNYFARHGNVAMGFVTQSKNIEMRDELRQAFNTLIDHLEKSPYNQRSKQRGSSYWGTPIEEPARMFEQWVNDQLAERGEKSPFLTDADPYIEERYAQMNYEKYKFFMGDKAMPYEEYKQTPQALNGLVYLTRDELQTFGKDLKHIFDTIQQKVDETTGKTLMYHKGGVAVSLNSEEVALRDAVIDQLRESGIDVVTDVSEGQRVLDMANGKERLSGKQKRALETASLGNNPRSLTVVSSADGAKVLKNVDELANKLDKSATQPKTFIGDVAKALGAKRLGSGSEYATFETKNWLVVTIRLSNHNAHVSHFDYNGRDNGISIVISPKPNEKLKNDGNAHITEFYYNAIKLRRADGKPLSEIVRSIKQALYSGEFKDTTGIAERQEVNGDVVREHRVYHGSGADFSFFDHDHMGDGEGAQAHGWGTYVAVREETAKGYAQRDAEEKNGEKSILKWYGSSSSVEEIMDYLEENYPDTFGEWLYKKWGNIYRVKLKGVLDTIRYGNEYDVETLKDELYYIQNDYNYSDEEKEFYNEVKDEVLPYVSAYKPYAPNLYAVEIPNNNNQNYIEEYKDYGARTKLRRSVEKGLKELGIEGLGRNAMTGRDIYDVLIAKLGSKEKTSKFFEDLGIVGVHYYGMEDGECYVIFNEKDLKITDHVRFFRTADGEAYGFTVGGRIYIDPRIASSETAVHEYAHLWAEALRSANAKEWGNVVGLMRGTSVWNEVMERYPELKSDDEIADEVLATYSGRRGSERLREEMDRIKGSERSVADKARALGALERVKRALDRFWHGVADFLGIHYKSAEEVADRVMRDLLNGVDPRRLAQKKVQNDIVQRENPMLDDYHTGIRSEDDIHTFAEAVSEAQREKEKYGDEQMSSYPDITDSLLNEAIKTGKITIYSSKPIKDGVFVTPSRMQAQDYAGGRGAKVYSKEVSIESVAWIDVDEGQFAEVKNAPMDKIRFQYIGEDGVSEGRGEQGRSLRGDEALTALNRIFDGEVKDELPPTIPTIEKFRQIFSKPIRTFLGELIKVKDNVYNKIQKEKRTRVSGAVMPTIKNADFAMRDTDGSTLYIKRFNNNTSDSTYNIAVVNKHGEVEDYISSVHIKRDANLRNKIKNGAELLLPNKRNGDGNISRNNSTPDAKLGKISEKSDANGTLFRDEVDGAVSSSGVDGMRERAVELGRELGADVDVVSDVSEISDANPAVQERKRRAKGWYDAKTGRVVINLAAHSDMADVEQTLLHEIVGHRGLRGLVGHVNFNGFLDGIYEHASGVVREGIDDIARRKGCSKRVATEEYMSGLAEGGFADRKNAGLWQKIRQWFGDMLSRAKIKLNFEISDNELRYLLWRSHELSRMNGREGVVGRARDLAMQNRLGVGNGASKGGERAVDSYDGDLETLFRDADSPVDYERALIRDSYERRLKDVWFQSREALQDGMLSLKETMKDIWRSAGKKFSQITDIPDYANPYLGQNRLSSRNAAEVRDFKHNLFRPLLREVGRLTGFSADGRAKLTDYMMAKHGLERNKVMAERVAKHPNSLTCGP